jgi:hypothetical protein
MEKTAVKAFAKEFVDVLLPQLVAAEEAKLPVAYGPLVSAITGALLPAIEKMLDDKIAAL